MPSRYAESAYGLHTVTGNVIAGVHDTGITAVWRSNCGSDKTKNAFSGNEIYSAMIGVNVLPLPGVLAFFKCTAVRDLTVWQATHVGIMANDQATNMDAINIAVADCHVGVSLNFVRTGSDSIVRILDSRIVGSTDVGKCNRGSMTCRSYSPFDTLGKTCGSIFGPKVRRVGITLPRYTNKVSIKKTGGGTTKLTLTSPDFVRSCARTIPPHHPTHHPHNPPPPPPWGARPQGQPKSHLPLLMNCCTMLGNRPRLAVATAVSRSAVP